MDTAELIAIAEITQLKYRYGRCLDNRQWDEFGATLSPNVKARYGSVYQDRPLEFDTRDAVVEYLSTAMSGTMITEHRFTQPEITVSGDTATGSWALSDIVIIPDHDTIVTGSAFYTDKYELGPDGWQIAETGYYRMYEATQPIAASNFTLLSNRFG
jgi:hypothetical protein